MATHKADPTVQWAGCWTLFCFSVNNPQRNALQERATEAILTSLRSHPEAPTVQEAGLWAIQKNFAQGTIDDWTRAVHVVVSAMKSHLTPNVQNAAQGALQVLSSGNSLVISSRTSRVGRRE